MRSLLSRRSERSCRRAAWSCLHSAVAKQVSSLDCFPEFKIAMKHRLDGRFDRAIVEMERVNEVLGATVGTGSMLSISGRMQLASMLLEMGRVDKAEQALTVSGAVGTARAHLLQALAVCKLLRGSSEESAELIRECSQLPGLGTEGQSIDELELISFNHGMTSLQRAYQGSDFKAAEHAGLAFLESAPTALAKLIAVNNLGAISALRAGQWKPLSSDPTMRPKESSRELEMAMKKALVVWDTKMDSEITGLIEEVRTTSADQLGGTLLQEELSVSLAHHLCSRTEIEHCLGDAEQASIHINTSLKLLSMHAGSENADGEGNSPVSVVGGMGRAVTMLGWQHLQAAEGVSAEGFFRKAIACLTDVRLADDLRYKAEAYAAMVGYAQLLKKWERREEHGNKLQSEAEVYVSSAPRFQPSGLLLGHFLQIPPIL